MILFFDKKTGKIKGTIQGRFHTKIHLKMWLGKRKEIGRIVVNWKPIKFLDDKGLVLKNAEGKIVKTPEELKKVVKGKKFYNAEFEPDCSQKSIWEILDKNPREVKKYKVDIKTKELLLK